MQDPPNKEYQTYVMHDQKPVEGGVKNHLEYGQQYQQEQETNLDDQQYEYQQQQGYQQAGGYQQDQGYQPGYQEQGGSYAPQGQPRVANPFQQQQQQQQQQAQSRGPAGPANPFRQGF